MVRSRHVVSRSDERPHRNAEIRFDAALPNAVATRQRVARRVLFLPAATGVLVPSTRFLDPIERTLEVLFGLIMTLVVTASIEVAESGAEQMHDVLVGAIGCNLAWGVVDAAMYLMANFAERARGLALLKTLHRSTDQGAAHELIADVLPPRIATALTTADYAAIRDRLSTSTESEVPALGRNDYFGALGVFLLVLLAAVPIVLPLVLMHDVGLAMRVSQGIGAVLLFVVGWRFGAYAGRPGWRTGLFMLVVGTGLTAMTFVLGG